MFTRRHMHLVIALLLPLMVLRAMLPPGYMPVSANGTLHIAMCSDGLQHSAVNRNSSQHSGSGDFRLSSAPDDCLFANAAVNAAPPGSLQTLVPIDFDAGTAPPDAPPDRAASMARVQTARGPPRVAL